jgi:hypothetical protein
MYMLVLALLNINLWLKIHIQKCQNQHTLAQHPISIKMLRIKQDMHGSERFANDHISHISCLPFTWKFR